MDSKRPLAPSKEETLQFRSSRVTCSPRFPSTSKSSFPRTRLSVHIRSRRPLRILAFAAAASALTTTTPTAPPPSNSLPSMQNDGTGARARTMPSCRGTRRAARCRPCPRRRPGSAAGDDDLGPDRRASASTSSPSTPTSRTEKLGSGGPSMIGAISTKYYVAEQYWSIQEHKGLGEVLIHRSICKEIARGQYHILHAWIWLLDRDGREFGNKLLDHRGLIRHKHRPTYLVWPAGRTEKISRSIVYPRELERYCVQLFYLHGWLAALPTPMHVRRPRPPEHICSEASTGSCVSVQDLFIMYPHVLPAFL